MSETCNEGALSQSVLHSKYFPRGASLGAKHDEDGPCRGGYQSILLTVSLHSPMAPRRPGRFCGRRNLESSLRRPDSMECVAKTTIPCIPTAARAETRVQQ